MDGNWPSSNNQNKPGLDPATSQRQHSQASGSDDEGEEDDSEASALSNFRKQWEAELKHVSIGDKTNTPTQLSAVSSVPSSNTPTQFCAVSPANPYSGSPRRLSSSHTPVPTAVAPSLSTDKLEEEAKKFFLMGVSFERRGDLYDAVRFYRRAMQLIPDIERRIQSELREEEPGTQGSNEIENNPDQGVQEKENDDPDEDDERPLYCKFIQRIEANGWQFFQKAKEDDKLHCSDFPVEILIYILRWVISSDLDLRSLDNLATVCRGFYCLSRDEKLWKMACDRVWTSCDILGSEFSTYREMFLIRPRVRFDGCYISRITYVRPGEHSFQDASYRPWHMVEYFRYLRFYPDGTLQFLTTAEKPAVSVGMLKDSSSRNPSILRGTYQLYGNNVISASVRKVPSPVSQFAGREGRPLKKNVAQEPTTEFQMDFEIEELKGKSNWVLRWTYYAVYISNANLRNNNNRNNNGEHGSRGITSTFELSPNKYPPLYFSRVKSYTSNSERILE